MEPDHAPHEGGGPAVLEEGGEGRQGDRATVLLKNPLVLSKYNIANLLCQSEEYPTLWTAFMTRD